MQDEFMQFVEASTNPYSMQNRIIYLASPYSHHDSDIVQQRVDIMTDLTAKLMDRCIPFSPVVYSHQLAGKCEPERGWYLTMLKFLEVSTELYAIKLDGWKFSAGMHMEIAYALGKGIPVTYLDPDKILAGFDVEGVASQLDTSEDHPF